MVGSACSHHPLVPCSSESQKNWNEPFKHDSFALLAPKNRNNRNQELEKKSGKEKPRILFSKIFDCGARAATGPETIQRRVPTHTSSTRSTKPHLAHGRRPEAHASECSFSLRFQLVPNPNNPLVSSLEHRTIGKRTPEWGYRCRHPPPPPGTFRVLGVFHYGLSLLTHEL